MHSLVALELTFDGEKTKKQVLPLDAGKASSKLLLCDSMPLVQSRDINYYLSSQIIVDSQLLTKRDE
jgi:hypothetical protein